MPRPAWPSALFFYATVESAGETGIAPALGWVVGIGAAVALGIAIYLGAVRIDLAQFFRWTGVGLVIVAIFITVILSERSTPVRRDLVYSPDRA